MRLILGGLAGEIMMLVWGAISRRALPLGQAAHARRPRAANRPLSRR